MMLGNAPLSNKAPVVVPRTSVSAIFKRWLQTGGKVIPVVVFLWPLWLVRRVRIVLYGGEPTGGLLQEIFQTSPASLV